MASIPTPRSYSQIVGDMLDAFLSKTGLPSVRVGSPHLSIIEAAAQSDLRSSQDIFSLLNSKDLNRATGQALDRIGADEDTPRIGEFPASGLVTLGDSSFTKIESKVFQGLPPPIIGADKIYVANAASFPASGQIYIGRGTSNYEGPLSYTSKVDNTNYWTLNLGVSSHTTRYHNLGESVILAQGGDRVVPAGTIVQTSQGNAGTAIQFSLLYSATIPDGEVEVEQVAVTAKLPGLIGNAIANSITEFASSPFSGATVTNPLPYNNGLATESDETYRERIRAARQSRNRGTALALKTAVTGITSANENKRIISANVVTREGYPTTLYIDDGTGYEEKDTGIAYESIVDSALGGEQYFQLVYGRPVAKAYAKASLEAPYNLQDAATLAVLVGGVRSEHSFSATEFRNISAGSAYEVVASINGNEDLLFGARTTDSGKSFAVFAKSDTNEDVEVVPVEAGFIDANDSFAISAGRTDTLRLYKNDRLLSKDGQLAAVTSNPQGLWAPLASPVTFSIRIDGVDVATTPTNTYSLTDADFINANTGYATLSSANSLEAWAKVFNYKIPGLTATVSNGALTLTSNRGRSSSASVEILACDLVLKNFFSVGTSTGADRDYTFDRNLGEIRLEDSLILHSGDRLTAGSTSTRAFLESTDLGSVNLSFTPTTVTGQNGAEMWFVVDGDAEIVPTGIATASPITISLVSTTTVKKIALAHSSAAAVFTNVQPGDWVIVHDSAFDIANRGAWRVGSIEAGSSQLGLYRPTSWATPESVNLTVGGITVVRTSADLQRVFITSGANYTASSLTASINSQLRGATASVYKTNRIRVRTNSFLIDGDIALVAANSEGLKLNLPVSSAVSNDTSHLAAVEAGHSERGTPSFTLDAVAAVTSTTQIDIYGTGGFTSDTLPVAFKTINNAAEVGRWGNDGFYSPLDVITAGGSTLTFRRAVIKEWLVDDLLWGATPYALTGNDELAVVVDGDVTGKRFIIPTFRRVKPGSSTYGITNDLKDKDNSDLSLAQAFGLSMNWKDFAVFMPARTKSHRVAGVDTNKTVLWRYKRLGRDGNGAKLAYTYPTAASSSTLVSVSSIASADTEIYVRLPSGAARTGMTYSNSTKLGYRVTAGPTGGLYTYTYVLNLPISSASREVRLNFLSHTGTWVNGTTVTGGTSGATGVIQAGSDLATASGKLIIATVVGTFINGETITSAGNSATVDGTQYGVAKLTLALPTGVTNHGFAVNDQLHMQYNTTGTTAGFQTSSPTVAVLEVPSGTQINYIEGTTAIGATASVGTVSFDVAEAKLTGSTVVAGDIFNVGASTGLPSGFQTSIRIATLADGYMQGTRPESGTVSGTLLWASINSTANLAWFPISGSGITTIVAAVNAQGASSPVTAVAVGNGAGDTSGSITLSTFDDLGGGDPWYHLSDGINWVRSNTNPVSVSTDYNFTFKDAVSASLATNSDWLNEDVRLVPITAEGVVNYFNTSASAGLYANGEIVMSNRAGRPQISTSTIGSGGSVQVQGGTANSVAAAVQGAAVSVAGLSVVTVTAADATGLSGGHWVRLQNAVPVVKARIDSNTNLDSISTNGTVIFDGAGTKAWDFANASAAPISNNYWQFTRQGDFVAVHYVSGSSPSLSGVQEGDWVHISSVISSGDVSTRNQGLFRVVRVDTTTKTFWIENENAKDETVLTDLAFLTYDSIVPGDKLAINTTDWNVDNVGTWTIAAIDLSTYNASNTNNRWKFTLDVSSRAPVAVVTPGPAALGTSSNLVQVLEPSPSSLIKKIHQIAVNPLDSDLMDIKFETSSGVNKVSEAAGTVVESLDKLGFSIDLTSGIDGYKHNTGLIEEANKVGYGVESDPATYPGVIAAGANVNIQAAPVRRVQISVAVRRASVGTSDIKDKVRSAIASVVNKAGVGQPVAIGAIVAAAQAVNGVISVTPLSPSLSPGSDLISIQPFEKALVLSLDEDVLISFVGE